MYICANCKEVFEEPKTEKSYLCSVDEMDYFETCGCCPHCGDSDFEEAEMCKICGEWHLDCELRGGACENCIDECRSDFETCYHIAADREAETAVYLNEFLASIFDTLDINQILMEFVRERMPDVNCSEFIDADIEWFGEKLVKRKGVE